MLSKLLTNKSIPASTVLVSMLFALLLQHVLGWQPCPLCILQRLSALALLVALVGFAACSTSAARAIWLAMAGFAMGVGLLFAGSQLYLILAPASATCGPGLALTMQHLAEALPGSDWFLAGAGACDDSRYVFLGLPLAAWSALAHGLPFGLAAWQANRHP